MYLVFQYASPLDAQGGWNDLSAAFPAAKEAYAYAQGLSRMQAIYIQVVYIHEYARPELISPEIWAAYVPFIPQEYT